jgi:CRP-like cAMP-binding protein
MMLTVGDTETNGFFRLFPFFSPEEKAQILLKTSCRCYKKGASVFDEGQTPDGLMYLSTGKVKIFKKGILDKEQIVRLIQSCQLLGFRALCAGGCYMASAKAIEPSTVCTIDRECFLWLMQTNGAFALSVVQHASRALGFADRRMVALTQKHMRARLADSLLVLANIYGVEADRQTLCVSLSRNDLANFSNMTTPNVTRTLSAFQDEGLVDFSKCTIRLLNVPAIECVSRHG